MLSKAVRQYKDSILYVLSNCFKYSILSWLVKHMIITYRTKIMYLLTSVETFVIFSNSIAFHHLETPNGGIYN